MQKLAFAVLGAALFVVSCKKKEHEMTPTTPELNINYPAAYVVNGESNTISVIRLSDNTVTETIKLGEMSDPNHGGMNMATGISWPHHVYINSAKTQLAIGVPGMDPARRHVPQGMSS